MEKRDKRRENLVWRKKQSKIWSEKWYESSVVEKRYKERERNDRKDKNPRFDLKILKRSAVLWNRDKGGGERKDKRR